MGNTSGTHANYAIEVRNLSYAYPGESNKTVLHNVSLNVPKGKIVALMGGSGSGKTTVLRLLTGQNEIPKHAEVIVNGWQVKDIKLSELYKMRRTVGMLFQFSGLFTDISVFDNVAFPLREHTGMHESAIHDLVLLKLHAVGLRAAARNYPSDLSGGQQRRVALARAVALDPMLMLYDEPFSGLDPVSKAVTAKLIKSLNEALSSSSLMITHDVPSTFGIADYVYVIWQGKVISEGTPEKLSKTSHSLARQFVNGESDGPLPFHLPGESIAHALRLTQPPAQS